MKWTYPLTTTDYIPGNIYGAVVLSDGVLYFGDGKGMVLALKAEDGRPYWDVPSKTDARIWSLVVVDDQNVYAASQDHFLYALNKKTGELIWKCPMPNIARPENKPGAGYGSITVADVEGLRHYVAVVGVGAIGVSADSGRCLWTYNQIANYTANIPRIVHG